MKSYSSVLGFYFILSLCFSSPFVTNAFASQKQEQKLTVELPFLPYRGSYANLMKGDLLYIKGSKYLHEFPWSLRQLDKDGQIRKKFASTTAVEKFIAISDLAKVGYIQSTRSDFMDQIKYHFEKGFQHPYMADWWGFCDRWSAAASNTSVHKFLTKDVRNGILCGENIFLSKGEIRELMSYLLYSGRSTAAEVSGTQSDGIFTDSGLVDNEEYLFLSNFSGFEDTDPALLHKYFSNIDTWPAVIQVNPLGAVWNYPVHRFEYKIKELSPRELSSDMLEHTALKSVRGRDKSVRLVSKNEEVDTHAMPLKLIRANSEKSWDYVNAYQQLDSLLKTLREVEYELARVVKRRTHLVQNKNEKVSSWEELSHKVTSAFYQFDRTDLNQIHCSSLGVVYECQAFVQNELPVSVFKKLWQRVHYRLHLLAQDDSFESVGVDGKISLVQATAIINRPVAYIPADHVVPEQRLFALEYLLASTSLQNPEERVGHWVSHFGSRPDMVFRVNNVNIYDLTDSAISDLVSWVLSGYEEGGICKIVF